MEVYLSIRKYTPDGHNLVTIAKLTENDLTQTERTEYIWKLDRQRTRIYKKKGMIWYVICVDYIKMASF